MGLGNWASLTAWFDMGFYLSSIAEDIRKRQFIMLGFSAAVLLKPFQPSWRNCWAGGLGINSSENNCCIS